MEYQYLVDPPDGWRYGFPKLFTLESKSNENLDDYENRLIEWFEKNNYPVHKIGRWSLARLRFISVGKQQ